MVVWIVEGSRMKIKLKLTDDNIHMLDATDNIHTLDTVDNTLPHFKE